MTADDRATRLRDRLRLFGYRMSGSLAWAEDMAETTLPQAGGLGPADDGDERRMLHGPALDRCLAELAGRAPRGLPAWRPPAPAAGTTQHGAADDDRSAAGSQTAQAGDRWLDPFPDALLPETGVGPAGSADALGTGLPLTRETVSLELVGALQTLPVDERAALVLHDLVDLDGADDDDAYCGRSPSGRHTGEDVLRSARASLARAYRQRAAGREPPAEPDATRRLMEYIFHWEAGDPAGLARMLTADVVFQSPPSERWYGGRDAVAEYLRADVLRAGERGRRRLLPCRANGQLAFGCYQRDGPGELYRAHSIHVVYFERHTICEIVVFGIPSLFGSFALLPQLTAQGECA